MGRSCKHKEIFVVFRLCQEFAVKGPISHHKLLSSISRYLLRVNRSSFMFISIATASLISDLSFGNAPTTLLRLFSSLFTLSNMFVVFILFQCDMEIWNFLLNRLVQKLLNFLIQLFCYLRNGLRRYLLTSEQNSSRSQGLASAESVFSSYPSKFTLQKACLAKRRSEHSYKRAPSYTDVASMKLKQDVESSWLCPFVSASKE